MIFDKPITNYRESDAGAWITSHADMETDDADDVYYLASCVAFLMEEKARAGSTQETSDVDPYIEECISPVCLHRFHVQNQRPGDTHQSAAVPQLMRRDALTISTGDST